MCEIFIQLFKLYSEFNMNENIKDLQVQMKERGIILPKIKSSALIK